MYVDDRLNSLAYDPDVHCNCVSYLKDYGSYYQISVCKFVRNGLDSSLPDSVLSYMSEGLSRSDSYSLLYWLRTGNAPDGWFENPYVDGTEDWPFPELKPSIAAALAEAELNKQLGRFINSIYRAKSTIRQLGECNEWDYFVTFTIDPGKYDRYDFKGFYKVFSKFKNHYKRDYGCKFRHAFVPEQHEDGAWHLHGLVGDLPIEHLKEYVRTDYFPYTDERLPKYILDKLGKGDKVYSWPAFADKFGFTVVEVIKDKSRAANYITKYIGKGFANTTLGKGLRLVLPSLGLKRAEQLKKGFARILDVEPSYDCDYATTFKFDKSKYNLDDVLQYFN